MDSIGQGVKDTHMELMRFSFLGDYIEDTISITAYGRPNMKYFLQNMREAIPMIDAYLLFIMRSHAFT